MGSTLLLVRLALRAFHFDLKLWISERYLSSGGDGCGCERKNMNMSHNDAHAVRRVKATMP